MLWYMDFPAGREKNVCTALAGRTPPKIHVLYMDFPAGRGKSVHGFSAASRTWIFRLAVGKHCTGRSLK